MKRKTLNPYFNESFTFEVTFEQIQVPVMIVGMWCVVACRGSSFVVVAFMFSFLLGYFVCFACMFFCGFSLLSVGNAIWANTCGSVCFSSFKGQRCQLGHPELIYIFNFWHSGTLALSPERQSVRMSKIKYLGYTWMALNTSKCNHQMPLCFKGLIEGDAPLFFVCDNLVWAFVRKMSFVKKCGAIFNGTAEIFCEPN